MTEDYRITTAGRVVEGRASFKAWVGAMQDTVGAATNEHFEILTNAAGDRGMTRGFNNGMFGLPATGEPAEFSGIAI